jgi:opacity protein-like surface antigen
MRSLPIAAVLAAALLVPSTAAAYEHQWHAGASFGYTGGWNGIGHGFGGGLDLGYGVKDWLDLTASLGVSAHPASTILVPSGTVGVRFAFDVVQVVPYIGAEIGAAGVVLTSGGCVSGCSLAKLDVAVPFGADYQLSRSFTIGAGGRFQLLLLNGSATPMLGAFARVQYIWGY